MQMQIRMAISLANLLKFEHTTHKYETNQFKRAAYMQVKQETSELTTITKLLHSEMATTEWYSIDRGGPLSAHNTIAPRTLYQS